MIERIEYFNVLLNPSKFTSSGRDYILFNILEDLRELFHISSDQKNLVRETQTYLEQVEQKLLALNVTSHDLLNSRRFYADVDFTSQWLLQLSNSSHTHFDPIPIRNTNWLLNITYAANPLFDNAKLLFSSEFLNEETEHLNLPTHFAPETGTDFFSGDFRIRELRLTNDIDHCLEIIEAVPYQKFIDSVSNLTGVTDKNECLSKLESIKFELDQITTDSVGATIDCNLIRKNPFREEYDHNVTLNSYTFKREKEVVRIDDRFYKCAAKIMNHVSNAKQHVRNQIAGLNGGHKSDRITSTTFHSFLYKRYAQGSGDLTTLLNVMKDFELVCESTKASDFKKVFSGKEILKPIRWKGNISELFYFVSLLHNTSKKVEYLKQQQWKVTCKCFVDMDDYPFDPTTLRNQQPPKLSGAKIEGLMNLI